MAVEVEVPETLSTASGVTPTFPVGFSLTAAEQLAVLVRPAAGGDFAELEQGVDYTLTGDLVAGGGVVTFAENPEADAQVFRVRRTSVDQADAFGSTGAFLPTMAARAVDKLTRISQEQAAALGRAVSVPPGEAGLTLPGEAARAGKYAYFDPDGRIAAAEMVDTAPATDFGVALIAAVSMAAVLALLGFTSTGVALAQATDAAAARAVLRIHGTTPELHGAAGDGGTDDKAALIAAIATGKPVFGDPAKTYAVSGDLQRTSGTVHLDGVRMKQLAPNNASRRTLWLVGLTGVTLRNCYIDRNGDGAGGSVSDAAGAWISGCAKVVIDDIEITGNDKGNGLVVVDCDEYYLNRPHIHTMRGGNAGTAAITDDSINGIWIIRGLRGVIQAPLVHDLTNQWTGQAEWTRFTRGIAVSGAADLQIVAPAVDSVDQGIDLTGSDNPDRIIIIGGVLSNCRTYGGKNANTVTFARWISVTARFCGYAGFVCSGWTGGAVQTSDIEFQGCVAIGTGSNGTWSAQNTAGFAIQSGGGAYATWPRGVKFRDCKADGISGVMKYGFHSDVAFPGNGEDWNEAIECSVENHTVAKFGGSPGLQQGVCHRVRSAVQSIPNNAYTAVSFDTTPLDRMGGATGTATQIVIKKAGVYSLVGQAAFATSGTGVRAARLLKSGPALLAKATFGATAGGALSFPITAIEWCEPGDIITLELFQDSGGALNTTADDVFLKAVLVNSARGSA